jgi:hypothetical protein
MMKLLRSLVLLLILYAPAWAQATAVLNDWKESVPDSVVSSGSNTNLIYNNGHGFSTGQTPLFQIYGATGPWVPINTHSYLAIILGITATDLTVDVDHEGFCGSSGTIHIDSEEATYTSVYHNVLTLSARGVNGTTAAAHDPSENVYCWAGSSPSVVDSWTASVIDANTLQIPLNSSSFGAFSGSLQLRRWTGDNRYVWSNVAEVGALWDNQTNSGYQQFMNSCTTGSSDIHQCLRAYWTFGTFNGKYPPPDWGSAACPITGLTVNSDRTTTVTLGTASTGCSSGYTLGANWIAYVSNMSNNLLNIRPYYVTVASSSQVTLAGVDSSISTGSYTGSSPIISFASPEISPYLFMYSGTAGGIYARGSGYMQNYIKSGTFSTTVNRLSFPISYSSIGNVNSINKQGAFYIGTYVKGGGNVQNVHNSPGMHYYHYGPPFTMYPGRNMKVEVNAAPDHQVGASGAAVWPNDPSYNGVWQYSGWTGYDSTTHFHYFDGLTSWYVNGDYGQNGTPLTMTVGAETLYTTLNEPEELVRTRTIVWAPTRVSDSQPGYEVGWITPKYTNLNYEVRYSTTGSLKTAGFSTGTTGGTPSPVQSQGSPYGGTLWVSPTMSERANIWVGIRPTDSIAGMTQSGQGPIWIVTQDDLGMSVGDHVTVSNVSGNTNANQTNVALTAVQPRQIWPLWNAMQYTITSAVAGSGITTITTDHANPYTTGNTVLIAQVTSAPSLNGTWTITVTGPTTFTIPSAISGYITTDQATVQQAGTLTSIVASSSVCTATTTVVHNLLPGWKIYVSGASDSTLGGGASAPAATWTVASVPSSTTFTFGCSGVANGTYNSSLNFANPLLIASWPGVALASGTAGNGTYSNTCTSIVTCGQIVSTENNKNFAEVTIGAQGSATTATPSSVVGGRMVGSGVH